jgi:hypothetical protein
MLKTFNIYVIFVFLKKYQGLTRIKLYKFNIHFLNKHNFIIELVKL